MIFVFYTIHVLICLFLILVVLLQQGKGADLSVFGGGGTMTAFGARGAATLLHKMTVIGFVAFIVTTLVIGVLQKRDIGSSVMSGVPASEATATADSEAEADEASADDVAGAFEEAEPAEASGDEATDAVTEGEAATEDDATPQESSGEGEADGSETSN